MLNGATAPYGAKNGEGRQPLSLRLWSSGLRPSGEACASIEPAERSSGRRWARPRLIPGACCGASTRSPRSGPTNSAQPFATASGVRRVARRPTPRPRRRGGAEFPCLPTPSGVAEVYPSKGCMDGCTDRCTDRYTPPLPWERASAASAPTAPRHSRPDAERCDRSGWCEERRKLEAAAGGHKSRPHRSSLGLRRV